MPENCENPINDLDGLSIEEKEALLKAVAQHAQKKEYRKQKIKKIALAVLIALLILGVFFVPAGSRGSYISTFGAGLILWMWKKHSSEKIGNYKTKKIKMTVPQPDNSPAPQPDDLPAPQPDKSPESQMTEDELTIISIHEAGHAVCNYFLPGIQEMKQIQIGGLDDKSMCGAVFFKDASTHLIRESVFKNMIAGYLGGIIAEKMILNESSSGSEQDLIAASAIARNMVALFGMGKRIGLCSLAELQSFFREDLETDIHDILNECQQLCEQTLTEHRVILEKLASELRNKKSLDEEEIKAFFAREAPTDVAETDDDDGCS